MKVTHFIENFRLQTKPMKPIDIAEELDNARESLGFDGGFKNGSLDMWKSPSDRGNFYIWKGDAMTPFYYSGGV